MRASAACRSTSQTISRKVTRNGVGTLLTTNDKKAQEFRTKKLTDETLQRIIGYSENKADVVRAGEEPVVVQAQTPDGAVQAEQIATRRGAPAAAKAVSRLGTKGAKVVATSVAAAQARRAAQATQTPPKAAAAVATSKERSTPKKRPAKKSAKDDERTAGPSEAQIEAGNYQKRHETVGGLGIAVETEAGQKRRPEWPALKNAYGYIKRSEGKDGEHVDVFLGGRFADTSLPVFVIDQMVDGRDRLTLPLKSHGYLFEIIVGMHRQAEDRRAARQEVEGERAKARDGERSGRMQGAGALAQNAKNRAEMPENGNGIVTTPDGARIDDATGEIIGERRPARVPPPPEFRALVAKLTGKTLSENVDGQA